MPDANRAMTSQIPTRLLRPGPIVFRTTSLLLVAASLFTAAGCATQPVLPPPAETTKYTLENTDRFEILDGALEHMVSCTGLMELPMADGRMEVVANLKNDGSQRLNVEAGCLFKDESSLKNV